MRRKKQKENLAVCKEYRPNFAEIIMPSLNDHGRSKFLFCKIDVLWMLPPLAWGAPLDSIGHGTGKPLSDRSSVDLTGRSSPTKPEG